jgi:hypothetical protein
MYLLPILRKQVANDLTQFWLFMERNGSTCMKFPTKEELVACAEESGFRGTIRQCSEHPELWLVTVEPNDASLPDFYVWNEVLPHAMPSKEVWRPFIWCQGDTLGVNGWLKEIEIAPGISLYSVLDAEA